MYGSQLASFIWLEVPDAIRVVDKISPKLLPYPSVSQSRVGTEGGNMMTS
jgi:hypothetical protein